MFKIVALFACLAFVAAMPYEDYHSHPSYKYEYGVKDSHTHDHKSQWRAVRRHVKGQYTLDEADGTHRVGGLQLGPQDRIQPHVQRIGHAHHPHHGESYANIKQHY
ncbi:hypothetical protein quinque_003458 [Culex quinquefasciatus]